MPEDKKPLIATLGILAFLLLGGLALITGGHITSAFPIALIILPIPGLITALVIYKSIELHKAKKWLEGSARITKSELKHRRSNLPDGANRSLNVPVIEYKFDVAGVTHHGSRIGIGETMPNTPDALKAVERYRVGNSVPVYYDPANPRNCVLERDMPVSRGCMWTGAFVLLACGFALTAAIQHSDLLEAKARAHMPNGAHPVFVAFFGGGGIFILMMIAALRRQAAEARRWPVVPGRVVASDVETHHRTVNNRRSTYYEAVVEYAYEVDGREYRSTQLRLGAKVTTGGSYASRVAARYPVDMAVEVHYDPENPANAVLDVKVAMGWLLVVIAALFFVAAAWFGGWLHT